MAKTIHCPSCNANWSVKPPVRGDDVEYKKGMFRRGPEVSCTECREQFVLPIQHGYKGY